MTSSPAPRPTLASALGFLLGLLCASLGAGCAQVDLLPEDAAQPECLADDDCARGLVCQAQRCVDAATDTLPIAIQLRYPGFDDDLRRQVTGLLFEPGLPMPDLEPLRLVPVRVDATRRTESVAATVGFRAQRGIPGTTIEVWGNTGERLDLLPGEYEVSVITAPSSGLPSRTYRGVVIAQGDAQEVALTLPLVRVDDGERLVVLAGEVRLLFLDASDEVPAQHVRVTAQSEDGRQSSQPYVTCVDDVDCDGTFRLILPPQTAQETRAYQLVLEPTQDNDTIPRMVLSRFEVGPAQLALAIEETNDSVTLSGPGYVFRAVSIPPFAALRGTILGADGAPVTGALLSAHAAWGEAMTHTATTPTPTDASGRFEVRLPDLARLVGQDGVEPSLTLGVTVEQASPWASGTFEVSPAAAADGEVEVTLWPKIALRGRVNGRTLTDPVAAVDVRVEPVDGRVGGTAAALTDREGAFTLNLEPASYLLSMVPPPASGLPRLLHAIEVTSAGAPSESFLLGRSSVVFGRVLDFDGEPAAGVSVEVFARDLEAARAVLVGTGTSDAQGVYRVIVPNPDGFDFFAGSAPR